LLQPTIIHNIHNSIYYKNTSLHNIYLYMFLLQPTIIHSMTWTWPASKEDFIMKYKKEFFVFIESIDFDNLKV
jgi:hypothetical protein